MRLLYDYLGGYLDVCLSGFSPERFLNLCMTRQIVIWNLRFQEGRYFFFIPLKDFYKVRPLARKAKVRLRITGRYGLPFFLHRNRKRKLSAAGFACFFLVLFVMSRFIWNITLEGNYRFSDDTLLHYLDQLEIRYGVRKRGIDCDSLEEAIRSSFPDIIWVSAQISGTRLMIKVKENDGMRSIPVKDETPRDLIAGKDGVITRMVVRSGKAQAAPGDEVKQGQVLVSGVVPIYNDAEELVNEQYVRADADIYAETLEESTESISKFTEEQSCTGKTRRGIGLRVGSLSFVWLLPAPRDTSWKVTRENRQMTVFGDFYLPIWMDRITAREYQAYERCLTNEEIEREKDKINRQKIENFKEKGVQIIENNVKILNKISKLEFQYEYVLEEQIGVGQNINPLEETKQLDERNRDNN